MDDVTFKVNKGTIHALIGQNGAGKSTLMKILAGDYQPTRGEILLDGEAVSFNYPRDSRLRGISIVYQELSLLPNLTVAENIFLGREFGRFNFIDDDLIQKEAKQFLNQLGVEWINVSQKIGELPLAQQQLVEIAKAISLKPRILILDEPTAALTPQNADKLFEILKRLRSQGIAIIHVTHRLKEIIENCDSGTVLRNGQVIETIPITSNTKENQLIELMIGQKVESFYRNFDEQKETNDQFLLEINDLEIGRKVKKISFHLKRGEILGITGLLGAGQNEVARALYGIQPGLIKGAISRNGKNISIQSPTDAISKGICLLTENRKDEGLFLDMSVKENISMPSLAFFLRSKFLSIIANARERKAVKDFVEKVNVRTSSIDAKIRTMSGGNQQKGILARWLLRDLEILIFIEPTRGIDVGAKAEIYRYLDLLAKEGKGIIVISPELTEILGVSDRIIVMHEGNIVQELDHVDATEEDLLAGLQGAFKQPKRSIN